MGLWSVSIENSRPSSMCLKCRIPAVQASSSLSKAEYRCWVGLSFFEKNPNGCQLEEGEGRCCRAAPTWFAEASTMRQISAPGAGWASRAALARAVLILVKAASISVDQGTLSLALASPRRASVRGCSRLAAAGRKRR
jgi:hypothetical protein